MSVFTIPTRTRMTLHCVMFSLNAPMVPTGGEDVVACLSIYFLFPLSMQPAGYPGRLDTNRDRLPLNFQYNCKYRKRVVSGCVKLVYVLVRLSWCLRCRVGHSFGVNGVSGRRAIIRRLGWERFSCALTVDHSRYFDSLYHY